MSKLFTKFYKNNNCFLHNAENDEKISYAELLNLSKKSSAKFSKEKNWFF